jgi:hypothetical protein
METQVSEASFVRLEVGFAYYYNLAHMPPQLITTANPASFTKNDEVSLPNE